jgi:hypothetical protein
MRNLIARRWARRDGAAALEWLYESSNEGYERDVAVMAAFTVWGQLEHEAALAWMAARMAGGLDPWLQPALPAAAKFLALDSPAEAIEWAERIEVDDRREYTLIAVARVWRQVDEPAAEAWLLQSSLSQAAREMARASGRGGRPNG